MPSPSGGRTFWGHALLSGSLLSAQTHRRMAGVLWAYLRPSTWLTGSVGSTDNVDQGPPSPQTTHDKSHPRPSTQREAQRTALRPRRSHVCSQQHTTALKASHQILRALFQRDCCLPELTSSQNLSMGPY